MIKWRGNTACRPCVGLAAGSPEEGYAMVVIARALLFAACCAFAVAACTNPNADASNKQSNRAVTNAFDTGNGGGGGGSGGY
jgi:hypothetical protein